MDSNDEHKSIYWPINFSFLDWMVYEGTFGSYSAIAHYHGNELVAHNIETAEFTGAKVLICPFHKRIFVEDHQKKE